MPNPPAKFAQRLKAELQSPEVEIKGMSGLSLKLDQWNQPAGVWQQLDNCDLYIPGSIRKILPATVIGGPYGTAGNTPILNFIDYFAQPNATAGATLRLLGIGFDANNNSLNIYNLATGAIWVTIPGFTSLPHGIPTLVEAPIYFVPYNIVSWMATTSEAKYNAVLKYDPTTGQLNVWYVSTAGTTGSNQPTWIAADSPITDSGAVWTIDGVPNSNRYRETVLIVVIPGFLPIYFTEWQYNPNSGSESPKVYQFYTNSPGIASIADPPEVPMEVASVEITPNLSGYIPVAGRAYCYTFYNPNLLHETSPAPIAGPTKITEVDASYQVAT